MEDKLTLLAEKVEKLVSLVETLKLENSQLKQDKADLTTEVDHLKKEQEQLKLAESDRSEKVQSKLSGILNKLDELERIAS